jgi:hypothetical protein
MRGAWTRCGVLAVAVAGSAAAPSALAAPPVISGADGDAWNTTPVYVVTGDATGVSWGWNVRSTLLLRTGTSGSSPFAVRPTGLRDGSYVLQVVQRNRPSVRPANESAERRFVVDTLAPRALEVLGPTTAIEGAQARVSGRGASRGPSSPGASSSPVVRPTRTTTTTTMMTTTRATSWCRAPWTRPPHRP